MDETHMCACIAYEATCDIQIAVTITDFVDTIIIIRLCVAFDWNSNSWSTLFSIFQRHIDFSFSNFDCQSAD